MSGTYGLTREPETEETPRFYIGPDIIQRTRKPSDSAGHDASKCGGLKECDLCLIRFATENRTAINENRVLIRHNSLLIQQLQRRVKASERQARAVFPVWKMLCIMMISVMVPQILGYLVQMLPN